MNRTMIIAVFVSFLAASSFAQVTVDLAPIGELSFGQTHAPAVCMNEIRPLDTTIEATSSNPQAVAAPPSVVIAAGILCTGVSLTAYDVGTATITVTAPSLGNISDSEIVTSKVLINTWSDRYITPGDTGVGHVDIFAARQAPVVVILTNDTPSLVTVPPSVTIPTGDTVADYPITGLSEGNAFIWAELSAQLGGRKSATGPVIVIPRDLEITGSASPGTALTGANVVYTLTATNHSSVATSAVIWQTVIGEFVSTTGPCTGPDPYAPNVNCSRLLAPGEAFAYTVTVKAPSGPGQFTSDIGIYAVNQDHPDPVATNNTVSIMTTVQAVGIAFSAGEYPLTEDAGPATISILRTSATSAATVTFTASAGTASAGTDFTTVSQTVNFLAGESSKNVSVPIVNDTAIEQDETVHLALTAASDGSPDRTATIRIRDDESRRPTDLGVTISAPASVASGGNIAYTVVGTNHGPGPMSATLHVDRGAFVSISMGSCDSTYGLYCTIPTLGVGQSVTLTLAETAPVDGSSVTGTATIWGGNNSSDPVPTNNTAAALTTTQRNFAFSRTAYSVVEGTPTATIKVIRFNSAGAATVTVSTADINAIANVDYTPVNMTLSFANGDNTKAVSVAVAADYVAEGDEYVGLNLTGASDGSPNQTSQLKIVDHDFTPTITSLVPATASTVGGQSITITGTNLAGATVTIGGTSATVTSSTATSIVCTTPAHVAGVVEVKVTTAAGSATTSITYVALPTIATISPAQGPLVGGQSVTMTGTNLTGATAMFGTTAATVTGTTSTTVTLTTPPHAAGTVDVKVTTTAGQATKPGGYTYRAAPTISAINPAAGPLTGGQSVTITGTGMSGATLTVGGTAIVPTSTSATSVVFTTRAHAAGAVNATVATPGGSATATGGYVYYAAPVVSSLSPTSGVRGIQVTITGANFSGATTVQFNGATAVFSVSTATQIMATVPAGATTGAITVTNPGGIGASSANFTVLLHGDANGDGKLTPSDVFLLINYLFASGAAPNGDGDANGDGSLLPNDVFTLINSIFGGG